MVLPATISHQGWVELQQDVDDLARRLLAVERKINEVVRTAPVNGVTRLPEWVEPIAR